MRVNRLDHEGGHDVPHPSAGMLNETHCMADQPTDLRLHGSACTGVDTRRVTNESDDEGSPRESGSEYQGLFFHLRRKMFGENQQVDPDDVGNQGEGSARRSIYATLVSVDAIQQKGKGGKSSGRESSTTVRRDESTLSRERSRRGEREESRHGDDRDRAGKGKGGERSRKGGQRERGTKGEGKRGGKQTLTSEGGEPGGEASWGDYRPPPADRDRTRGRDGGRRDEQSETETRQTERSRPVREPTVPFRSPQRENEDASGIRMPARATETGAETTGDERINIGATHVKKARSRDKMSIRSTASAGEESQAERQRKADREARLKSKVKKPRDDDDDDDVMN